ncbi:WD40 repeat domain-containing protein [Streptomyces sp. 351MFTsu5.1]|uniref:WD40 repeat domain-containing protein n=1 Tax=Streptomyces sp. 351MFTsu5.1 TaxID=1172180 RepID=UPI0003737AEE|nr:WD40 repeat domain-containing protein [Streptomyces sp. 351MFTsu5.1]
MTAGTTVTTTVPPDITAWPPLDEDKRSPGQRLLDWAADGEGPRLCLVRGAEGSGKSALLAWLLAGTVGRPGLTIHATVPSEGLTTETFAWELGRQLGYGALSPDRLLDRVGADERPLLLLVPDLHRAGAGPVDLPSATPETLVAELLEPLLALPHLRAAVEIGTSALLAAHSGAAVVDLGEGDGRGTGRASYADLAAEVPRTADDRPDWSRAPAPVRRRILDAALRADGQEAAVRGLLTDPGFLVHGSAAALTATLADERIPVPGRLREVWRRAAQELTAYHADSAERAALLHAAAIGTDPDLAEYLRPLAAQHWWSAEWARPAPPVTALALIPGEERQLMASDATGRLRTYDVQSRTGAPLTASPRLSDEPAPSPSVHPLAVRPRSLAPRDARSALLLDGSDALLPLVTEDEPTTAFALGRIAEHHGAAALTEEDALVTALGGGGGAGRPYAVVGDRGGSVHVWSLGEYQDVPRSHRVHEQPVTAAVCVDTADGLTLTFSAGADGSVRLWEISAEPMPVPVQQRPHRTTALAAADTSAGPVLAVAWTDGELHLWHVLSGGVRVLPWLRGCDALTLTPEGLLVIGDGAGLCGVRLRWDVLWEG